MKIFLLFLVLVSAAYGQRKSVVQVPSGGSGDSTVANHNILVGRGILPFGVIAPGSAGQILTSNGASADPSFQAAGGGSGTVTSVGLALPAEFTISGSPVTSSGILTGTWASQTANKVFVSPNGSSGTPAFRALVAADLPTVDVLHGGTGQTTASAALTALLPSQGGNSGKFLQTNGSSALWTTETQWIYPLTNNNYFGFSSGNGTLSGSFNTSFGSSALSSVTSSTANTAIGFLALNAEKTSYGNTAIGYFAGRNLISGAGVNVAVGYGALLTDTNAYFSVALGESALSGNMNGHDNVAVGTEAGRNVADSSHYTACIFLGSLAGQYAPGNLSHTFIAGGQGPASYEISDVYFGSGYQNVNSAAGVAYTIHGSGAGSGNNFAGGNITFAGGAGRGTGNGGHIIFDIAKPGSTGSTFNALTEAMRINDSGAIALGVSTNYGADGQVLTTHGSGSPPTWTSQLSPGTPATISLNATGTINGLLPTLCKVNYGDNATIYVTQNLAHNYTGSSGPFTVTLTPYLSNAALDRIDFTNAGLLSLNVDNNATVKEILCDNNTSLGNIQANSCTALQILSLVNTPALQVLDATNSALVSITTNSALLELNVSGCTALAALNCPNHALGNISISNCPALDIIDLSGTGTLTSVNLTNVGTDISNFNFTGQALDAASVNNILADCVASGGVGGSVDLSGGTSAAPTGQGITDAATLTGNGWTVTTN